MNLMNDEMKSIPFVERNGGLMLQDLFIGMNDSYNEEQSYHYPYRSFNQAQNGISGVIFFHLNPQRELVCSIRDKEGKYQWRDGVVRGTDNADTWSKWEARLIVYDTDTIKQFIQVMEDTEPTIELEAFCKQVISEWAIGEGLWMTKDKSLIPITQMSNSHLMSAYVQLAKFAQSVVVNYEMKLDEQVYSMMGMLSEDNHPIFDTYIEDGRWSFQRESDCSPAYDFWHNDYRSSAKAHALKTVLKTRNLYEQVPEWVRTLFK